MLDKSFEIRVLEVMTVVCSSAVSFLIYIFRGKVKRLEKVEEGQKKTDDMLKEYMRENDARIAEVVLALNMSISRFKEEVFKNLPTQEDIANLRSEINFLRQTISK